jgi:hypothetical protein
LVRRPSLVLTFWPIRKRLTPPSLRRPTDQMGVELGKVLAKNILAQLGSPEAVKGHDSSVRPDSERILPSLSDNR